MTDRNADKKNRIKEIIGMPVRVDKINSKFYRIIPEEQTAMTKAICSLFPKPELLSDRPKIVCLRGSSRFIETFAVLAWEFEKEGAITLGLHNLPPSYTTKVADHIAEAEGVAKQMDELHRRKIDLADEIFVINVNGYIGESTRNEIEYAEKHGKPIKYLEPVAQAQRDK